MKKRENIYQGFEQGPIRPPSEAESLLIRLTRNCPWNRCTFCPVYKGKDFSLRSVENIIKDIDILAFYLDKIINEAREKGRVDMNRINTLFNALDFQDRMAFNAALHWYSTGMNSIFIQDANSLIMKPGDLVYVLEHIKKSFPMVKRITSYARSHTLVRIKSDDMKRIADAGLNRIHVGLESGSDKVLKLIKKGCTKDVHIKAGIKVKNAGMELSEYVMPGLGGIALSTEHALESADALNQINPDFIRLRTLAIPGRAPMAEELCQGRFEKCTDLMVAEELKLFLENLNGITSYIKSDHILNLLEDVEGKMPGDKDKVVGVVDLFLSMEPEQRMFYQVGRRMGLFRGTWDMADGAVLDRVKETCRSYNVTVDNVDSVIEELMKRFV
ncbi:MAG: radical SAM protein [Thermodesulfobacteriota bacterium]|nr:radical SAM protein [Thermodesulfobacteriota bacterium]